MTAGTEPPGYGSSGRWDLVVVGAGPAGSAAALGALTEAPGLRVLLLDRADFPRDKCCGDGIAPHVFDALAGVGVHDAADGWAPVRDLRLARGGTSAARPMAREARVIPRKVFDARLVEHAVRAGAVLRRHRVSTVEGPAGSVVLDGRIASRVVVGADGANSSVRARVGHAVGSQTPRAPRRRALAIRGYAPTPDSGLGSQVIRFGDRRHPSYAWAFDRGDGLSNVGYGELLGRGAPPSRALLLGELERLLPGAVERGTGWRAHHLPLSGWRWDQPDGGVLLVGDAAGLVNPLTGEGIYYAVATGISAGRAAARALAAGDPAAAAGHHRRAVRGLLGAHLRHTWVASRLAGAPAVLDAGLRAADRDGRVFDDLVEIGLGGGRITPRLAAALAGGLLGELPGGLPGRRRNRPSLSGPTTASVPSAPSSEEW